MLLYKNYVTKKEASTHFQSEEITQSKTRFSENETSYPIEPMAVHDIKPIS